MRCQSEPPGSGHGDKPTTRRCSAECMALGAPGQLTLSAELSRKAFWPVALPVGVLCWVEPTCLDLRD